MRPTGDTARISAATNAAYAGFSDTVAAGGATVLLAGEAPDSPMVNRIVGLGLERPATEEDVDLAIAAVPSGTTFYAAVAPDAQPAALSDWLQRRGLEPGWGWMTFTRPVTDPPAVTTDLDVVRTATGRAADFARIVRVGYGLPEALEPRLARVVETLGWHVFTAVDGAIPVATAGIFVRDRVGYLGFAATVPEHRGRGGQGALLAARIEHARQLGCDVLVTETGERRDELPSNSYRNILRAGFEEQYVVANWVGTAGNLTPSR